MAKLKLCLDDLDVQSFDASPARTRGGTIFGLSPTNGEYTCNTCDGFTCNGDVTACVDCEQQTATCQGCGGGVSGVDSCAYTCPICTPSQNQACTVAPCTYTCTCVC